MFFDDFVRQKELDEVKNTVADLQQDTTEIKAGISVIKWIVMVMIGVVPIMTTFFEEAKDSILDTGPNKYELRIQQMERQIEQLTPSQ